MAASELPVTVNFSTADGTAMAGFDYLPAGWEAPALRIVQAGQNVLLSWTSAWDGFALQAKATLSGSSDWRAVTNLRGDVAIVRNFSDPEIATLQEYLFEIGLTSHVFAQEGLTFQALTNFSLILWDDLGTTNQGLTDKEVSLFQRVYDADIPLYFIGESLASATVNLTEPYRSQWVSLTHLNPANFKSTNNGIVWISADTFHPVINGNFGLVLIFAYLSALDVTTVTGRGEVLLGETGDWDVLLANEDSGTQVRTVTQNVLAVNGADEDSLAERKTLFENAV